jgi:hypothetical protein
MARIQKNVNCLNLPCKINKKYIFPNFAYFYAQLRKFRHYPTLPLRGTPSGLLNKLAFSIICGITAVKSPALPGPGNIGFAKAQ